MLPDRVSNTEPLTYESGALQNICCDPKLEPSRRDGSNDGSQRMFLSRGMENYSLIIPVMPS